MSAILRVARLIKAEVKSSNQQVSFIIIAAMLLSKAGVVIVGVLVATVLARQLGPDGYGFYLIALTFAHVGTIIGLMGSPVLVMRTTAIANHREAWSEIQAVSLWTVCLIALILLISLLFLASASWFGVIPDDLFAIGLIGLLFASAMAAGHIVTALIRGLQRPLISDLISEFARQMILLATLLIYGTLANPNPTSALLINAFAACLTLIGGIAVLRWIFPKIMGKLHRPLPFAHRQWLKQFFPLGITAVAYTLASYIDIIMLGALSNDTASVAIYRVGLQFAALTYFVQAILFQIITPRFGPLLREDRSTLRRLIAFATPIAFGSTILGTLALLTIAPYIIPYMFGSYFSDAASLAVVIATGYAAVSAFGPVVGLLTMSGRDREIAFATVGGMIANIGMNAALIPSYGALGAAVSTAISAVGVHALLAFYVRIKLHERPDVWQALKTVLQLKTTNT